MHTKIFLGLLIGILVLIVGGIFFVIHQAEPVSNVACTMEARVCPDGSYVGRTGPSCEFAPCPSVTEVSDPVSADIRAHIDAKKDLIVLTTPSPMSTITSPVTVTGKARGYWFFEGSFPISIVNWDGLIIGEGYATAEGEWMTEEFVPFTGTVNFVFDPATPYNRGAIILKKDNPSGLPEYDDALEIPITF
jgi:hypothetical protein